MTEPVTEMRVGAQLVSFDGRVLELFGGNPVESNDASRRFHVANLTVDIGDPDRRGRRLVTFVSVWRQSAFSTRARTRIRVEPQEWSGVEELLARVTTAIALYGSTRG